MPTIYRITYPNGKIYVGKDLTDTLTYFGSPNAALVSADFPPPDRVSFTLTKDILWRSDIASPREVAAQEVGFIRTLCANNPAIGYNRWPRFAAWS
ncbi:GIY-YIG nuclease family protein [Acuticoccus mangrovi]|uniref:GIY-YIG nuclease family protein n=1 Tax=Acuticoccus mangrovi TaxID=2796142 RepID=A0A934MII1_9HYPH|nr:hypothetical protein [Acuticoccus mangrovi]MBJ3777940.1 hypothetical protein [Acuticoccus mangrovi]